MQVNLGNPADHEAYVVVGKSGARVWGQQAAVHYSDLAM